MFDEELRNPRRRRAVLTGIGLTAAGVAAGAVIATAWGAGASTPGRGSAGTTNATYGYARDGSTPAAGRGAEHALDKSGTVTAVGTSSVTIKTSTGTTTYTVDSNSDIDKNGEAKLSDLKVGDKVIFSTTGANNTVIDKLHSGNEALNRPAGEPAH